METKQWTEFLKNIKSCVKENLKKAESDYVNKTIQEASADPEGGGGQAVWTPPGKSQVIWVSIGNKQLDPPPWKKFDLPWIMLDPLWNLEK